MNDFLKTEYEQCFDLIKLYEERNQSLVKFASAISGAVPSLLLAIYKLSGNAHDYFWQFSFIISLVVTISLISIFTILIQTRLYFVYPVRQVNSIRKYCLQELKGHNFENQMYLSTSFNAFKWTSSHTFLNFFISMQAGVFAGLTAYIYFMINYQEQCIAKYFVLFGASFTLGLFIVSSLYLYINSKYHPDKCIHKET